MSDRIEKLLNQQIELIGKLQAKVEEVLNWKTSPEYAEATASYFEALESAVDSLDSLSEFYDDFEEISFDSEEDEEDEEDEEF